MQVAPNLIPTLQESPADRLRYASRYSSFLSPLTLRFVFSNADYGSLGPLMELEQELFKDELVIGMVSSRLAATSKRTFRVKANRSDPDPKRAAEVADFGNQVLSQLRLLETRGEPREVHEEGTLPEVVTALARSAYYGMGLHWAYWETPPGMPRPWPTGLEPLDERRFRLHIPTKQILVESQDSGYLGVPISEYDPWQMMLIKGSSIVPRIEHAGFGRSMAFIYYLRYQSKLNLLKYGEKFSVPGVIGSYTGSSDDIKGGFTAQQLAALQLFIQSYMNDVAGLFPPNFKVDLVPTPANGEKIFDFIDKNTRSAMAIAALGQDGTSDGAGGSLAKAEVNFKVLMDLVFGDMRRVGGFLIRLISFAVALEFGPGVPPPEEDWQKTEEERLLEEMKKLEAAQKYGLPVSMEYALGAIGLPMPEDGAVLTDGSVWDAKNKRRVAAPSSGKEAAEVLRTSAYPLTALLSGGVAVDVPEYAKQWGIPLDETKPPYTPPEKGPAKTDGEDASPQEDPGVAP